MLALTFCAAALCVVLVAVASIWAWTNAAELLR